MSEDKSLLEENKLLKERLAGEFDIDLTSKSGLNSVLEKIVEQSRRVTNSIGGSIYLKVRGEKNYVFLLHKMRLLEVMILRFTHCQLIGRV